MHQQQQLGLEFCNVKVISQFGWF